MQRAAAALTMPVVAVCLGLATTVGLAPGAGAAPPAARATDFTPGAPGIGDPYYPLDGNGGYDVRHYRLDLRYDPATDRLSGSATITADATRSLSRFDLDLDGLHVAGVTVDGRPAAFRHPGHELVVTPAEGILRRQRFTTVVRYAGVPKTLDDGSGFVHTDDGALVIGEPPVAATWFPANDHPLDKALYSFRIEVPQGREVVANGKLVGSRTAGGWTTWHWESRAPMAPYLATASVGDWDLTTRVHDGITITDAVDPDLLASGSEGPVITASLGRQGEVLDFLSSQFGPYPFDAAGAIVDDVEGLGFALENQTRPIYARDFFDDPLDGIFVVVHELAHQWYGDSLSVSRWKHVWLNEGFATYAEWLWSVDQGLETPAELFDSYYFGIPAGSEFWRQQVADPGSSFSELFAGAVYLRGAMTLEALRRTVGDGDFTRILRQWAQRHQYGNVGTHGFVQLAERISGQSLRTLFRDWLWTTTRPPYPTDPSTRSVSPTRSRPALVPLELRRFGLPESLVR